MPARHILVEEMPADLREGVEKLRTALAVPASFPDDVVAEAERAASGVALPERDLTDVPFVTIDPEGARDLDQAVHLERSGEGYLVRYAIADVAAFVAPGGAIDAEAHRRGVTLYAPTMRTPLHPPVLSEGAASLLPGEVRPALVWELTLDASGATTHATVARARVRSTEQLSYAGVQRALDDGSASAMLGLLREVGQARERLEIERGGVSLNVPEQEVHATGDVWELAFGTPLPVEGWNAQISLMTGMAAAAMMLQGRVGLLRTLPPAKDADVERLRATARALRIAWPASTGYPDFVRSLDPAVPAHAAMLNACTTLFRGAGYAAFDGEAPEQPLHAALATPYAHCTAPLRRLADRYAGEVCVALCAGSEVPGWVRAELPGLPETMTDADRRAKKYERGIVDLVEALVLRPHVGETFTGTVLDLDSDRGQGRMQVQEPAIQARVDGRQLRLGEECSARLVTADVVDGVVRFEQV